MLGIEKVEGLRIVNTTSALPIFIYLRSQRIDNGFS